MKLPEKLMAAVEQFRRIPGIGEKTALRQVLLLANWDHKDIVNFGESIQYLTKLKHCASCNMLTETELCHICEFPLRRQKTLCVVETMADCLAIEKSERFQGHYFVLGGVLNPLLGIGPRQLKLDFLTKKVEKDHINEIILALNPSVEGDATGSYIKELLPKEINIARIGLGMPMGGSLEYLDTLTISKALENKTLL